MRCDSISNLIPKSIRTADYVIDIWNVWHFCLIGFEYKFVHVTVLGVSGYISMVFECLGIFPCFSNVWGHFHGFRVSGYISMVFHHFYRGKNITSCFLPWKRSVSKTGSTLKGNDLLKEHRKMKVAELLPFVKSWPLLETRHENGRAAPTQKPPPPP